MRNAARPLVRGAEEAPPVRDLGCAYPECHPDSADATADIDNFKAQDGWPGANRADHANSSFWPEAYSAFATGWQSGGPLPAEIVPGILPVSKRRADRKFAGPCARCRNSRLDGPGCSTAWTDHPAARQLRRGDGPRPKCAAGSMRARARLHFYTLQPPAELSFRDLPFCWASGRRRSAKKQRP